MASKLALIAGIVFLLVGITGLFGGLGITGPDGVFATDTAHDLIHLVTGIILVIVATQSPLASSITLIVIGILYLFITLLGFLSADETVLGILINNADDYLHLILGALLLIAGLGTRPQEGLRA